MPDIRHRVAISAPFESVYEAVATTEGISEWWTRDGVRGESTRRFQPSSSSSVSPNRPLSWRSLGSSDDGQVAWSCVGGADEWMGTKLTFDLTETDGETVVLFTHADWREPERVHGPLQCPVGLLPAQPKVPPRDRKGHAVPGRPEILNTEVEPLTVDVFKALADPSRRHLLDRLNARNGQSLRELSEGLDMTRQSVSKHLAILEAANLVTTIRRGPREAPLPQRRADQRDRRTLDQSLRPRTSPSPLGPQTSTGGVTRWSNRSSSTRRTSGPRPNACGRH